MVNASTIKSIQDIMRKDVGVDGDAQRLGQLVWMLFLKIFDDREYEWEAVEPGYVSPIPAGLRWRDWAADDEGLTGDELSAFVNNKLFPKLKALATSGQGGRAAVVGSVFEDAYNYMKSGQLLRQVINKIQADIDFNKSGDRHTFGDLYEQLLKDLQSAGNAGEYYTPRAVTQFMVDMIDPKLGESILDPACGTGGFLTCSLEHVRKNYVRNAEDEQTAQAAVHGVEKKPLPHLLCTTNMILHGVDVPTNIRHDNTLARPLRDYGPAERVDIVLTNPPFGGTEEDGIENNFPSIFRTRETADLFLVLMMQLIKPTGRGAVVLPEGSLFGEGIKARIKERLLSEFNLHTVVRLPNSVFRPYASLGTNLLFFERGEPTTAVWFYEHRVPENQKAYSKTKPIKIEHFAACAEWWGGPHREGRKESDLAWKVQIDEIRGRNFNLDFKNPNSREADHEDAVVLQERLRSVSESVDAARDTLATLHREALVGDVGEMLSVPEVFGGLPEETRKVRNVIVAAAVAGHLDAGDGATEDVLRIQRDLAKTRDSLVQSRRMKRPRSLPPVAAEDLPARSMEGRVFMRLQDVATIEKGKTGIKGARDGEFPLVVTGEDRLTSDHYDFDGCGAIIPLVSSSGHGHASIKRLHYQEGRFALGSILCAASSIDEQLISTRFLYEYLTAFKDELLVRRMLGTANVSLSLNKVGEVPVPIISSAAQRRAIELMSACDVLEAAYANETKVY